MGLARLVVVGGSAAGMAAAARAKRARKDLEVVVFERSRYVSYAPCGIPYYVQGLIGRLEDLTYYTVEYFRKERGIDVKVRHEVVDVDPSAQKVYVRDLERNEGFQVEYDYLVLATGGKPSIPEVEGVNLEGIYTLRTLEDGERVKAAGEKAETIGIVGGGYIGLEMAEAFRSLGKKVILIQRSYPLRRALDKKMAEDVEKVLVENGVELHLGEELQEFKGHNGKVAKVVTSRGEYRVDMVILALGVKPNVDLAAKMGVKLGSTGAIEVDEYLRTSLENVYAAGDNVETIHLVTGKPVYLPFAPSANKMGRIAGGNIAGGRTAFKGVLGTSFVKVFNLHVARTGLTLDQARQAGFDAVAADIWHGSRSHYYPGGCQMHIQLVADRASHRILGAAITGEEGVTGRINTVAAAIWGNLTVEDLTQLDLGYAPPFAPVWDGLVVAATVLSRQL